MRRKNLTEDLILLRIRGADCHWLLVSWKMRMQSVKLIFYSIRIRLINEQYFLIRHKIMLHIFAHCITCLHWKVKLTYFDTSFSPDLFPSNVGICWYRGLWGEDISTGAEWIIKMWYQLKNPAERIIECDWREPRLFFIGTHVDYVPVCLSASYEQDGNLC